MPRLKACGQGSEAPAHLQLRHCAAATLRDGLDRLSKSGDAGVTDLVVRQVEFFALRQCPAGACRSEGSDTGVSNLIVAKGEKRALRHCPIGYSHVR